MYFCNLKQLELGKILGYKENIKINEINLIHKIKLSNT